ncbi:hypothetical protein EMPS_09935 [Entomortierella parvispora]|uniref:Uncharacterized protein n=1 Tax=Entomortierella parvispora TaxID=205924 RepID=A0A9P3M0I4_9FUNG|nr:hypothetical protein EMPS_09935 [Entomortierella parvispora]
MSPYSNTSKHIVATRDAIESLSGEKVNGAQNVSCDGVIVIDKTWYSRVATKLQYYGFPTSKPNRAIDHSEVLEEYRSSDTMMGGGVSVNMIFVCATVAADTWAHAGPIMAWTGAALSSSVAALVGGICKVVSPGDESKVQKMMTAAVPNDETALINDVDLALDIDGQKVCGCDDGGLCASHYIQTIVNTRKDTSMPAEEFIANAARSSVVTSIDLTRVATSSVLKTRPAAAHIEGGKWYEYVQNSRIPPLLWQRHFGVPVVLNSTTNQWLAAGCIITGSRLSVGGYLSDCGALRVADEDNNKSYAFEAARDERAWRETIGAAEVCVSVQVTHTWNSLMNEMAVLSRNAGLPFVVLETLSARQRSCMLVLDSCLQHCVLTEDAGAMSFPDLVTTQIVNGYSDQAEDIALHAYNNGLFLGFGVAGAVFDDDHPAVYGSLCRSMMAACQYRRTTPCSQAICYTILWNLLNGRHRSLEKGVYVKWGLLAEKFSLPEKLEKWKLIEWSICVELCGEEWVKETTLMADHLPADGSVSPSDLWARTMYRVGHQNGCSVEALVTYFCADCDCTPEVVCSLHGSDHGGSDAMGELAMLMEKTAFGMITQSFGWLLCGVAWFRRALHLRCGFMGYALIGAGAKADATCA